METFLKQVYNAVLRKSLFVFNSVITDMERSTALSWQKYE